ncbi:MAG: alpha-galactosidase [Bacteroidia bacterium]|nr:alpha-galactosidase [Bacteroidia bacterium]
MKSKALACLLLLTITINVVSAQKVQTAESSSGNNRYFSLANGKICIKVTVTGGILASDTLTGLKDWISGYHGQSVSLVTDANYSLDIVWAYWSYTGRPNNAENPVAVDKNDFMLKNYRFSKTNEHNASLELLFKGKQNSLNVMVTYLLEEGKFWCKRKVAVSDSVCGSHFLDFIYARKGDIAFVNGKNKAEIIKKGEFGQPVAATSGNSGCFFGLEYPGSTNTLDDGKDNHLQLSCYQEFGRKIEKEWIESEWVVEAGLPSSYVQDWFMKYISDIRVAPAKPYSLYNSWYDLRSPSFKDIKPDNIMNEQNIMNIISLFKKNLFDKYNLKLDAFVLDDGWDNYESDWKLNTSSFPHGLKPVSDKLKSLGVNLGIWYGPIGGYSFHEKRVSWMKANGYEVIPTGFEPDEKGGKIPMLCLAGKKYGELFRTRTTSMVANDGVSYFKWDGIQFACNETDHGHATGLFSRRAVIESLIDKCRAVRAINPDVYLNITSGTWLSPWWVKYANQIWMAGEDYGFARIPSLTIRDEAMTYKDYVLFDDFHNKNFWFPIANLMVHGIIKGDLESVGGGYDPLESFTNDAMLYFSRGISMYELYISPGLLNDGEWNAIARSLKWAKDRKDILANTFMTDSNPMDKKPYAYLHFNDKKGIITARNPYISPSVIKIHIGEEYGLSPDAKDLVLERVYPDRWISPRLYSCGNSVEILLSGYEVAVYELYPLSEAKEPLIAGVNFDCSYSGKKMSFEYFGDTKDFKILNPGLIRKMEEDGHPVDMLVLKPTAELSERTTYNTGVSVDKTGTRQGLVCSFQMSAETESRELSILLIPAKEFEGKDFPEFEFSLDNINVMARGNKQDGHWAWITFDVTPGLHKLEINTRNGEKWSGNASVWSVCIQKMRSGKIDITAISSIPERNLPPLPYSPGLTKVTSKIGEVEIKF